MVTKSGSFSTNRIFSVGLLANGDFGNDETEEILPNTPFNTNRPISDIAFTADGNKMLLGQQNWSAFGVLNAHSAEVKEFSFVLGSTWKNSGNYYQTGWKGNGTLAANSVGGVSYSNNILLGTENQIACDSSVWFTSDYIWEYSASPRKYNYGIQGMRGINTANTERVNSIIVDQDDENLGTKHETTKVANCEH